MLWLHCAVALFYICLLMSGAASGSDRHLDSYGCLFCINVTQTWSDSFLFSAVRAFNHSSAPLLSCVVLNAWLPYTSFFSWHIHRGDYPPKRYEHEYQNGEVMLSPPAEEIGDAVMKYPRSLRHSYALCRHTHIHILTYIQTPSI